MIIRYFRCWRNAQKGTRLNPQNIFCCMHETDLKGFDFLFLFFFNFLKIMILLNELLSCHRWAAISCSETSSTALRLGVEGNWKWQWAPGACKGCVSDTLGRMASLLMWMGLPFSVCGPKYAIFAFLWQEQPFCKRKSALTWGRKLNFCLQSGNHKPGLYGCVCTCFLQGTGFILFLFSHDKFVKEGTNERKIVLHV